MKSALSPCLLAGLLAFAVSPSLRADIALITPAEAKQLLDVADAALRPVVLDTRGGYKDYFRGHIPGAHHLNFDTLRGTEAGVPVQYLPSDLTRALLVRAGADRDRTHLVYATGAALPNDEVLSATMVAHVLEKVGIKDIRIVDGGLPAWQEAGFPVAQAYFGNAPGRLPALDAAEIAASLDYVLARQGQPGVVLVDARPPNEFAGDDDVWLRKGHIPGAVNFHWARLTSPDNTHRFRSFAEVKADLVAAGLTPDKEIICYCGTSREGSLLRFYLRYVAGYKNVRLYEGAWKEYVWARNQSLPVETGPGGAPAPGRR